MVRATREDRKIARMSSAEYLEEVQRYLKIREDQIVLLLSGTRVIREGQVAVGNAILELRKIGLKAKDIQEVCHLTAKEQAECVRLAQQETPPEESDDDQIEENQEELDSEVAETDTEEKAPVAAKASDELA